MLHSIRVILAAALLLTPIPALAASYIWNPQPVGVRTSSGAVASGAKAYFFLEGTTTPLTTYSDSAQTTPNAHPVVANSQGVFSPVYIPYSATGYKVRVTTSGGTTIQEIDGIARNSPPESGGGGGIVVATEQVFQPGDVKFRCVTGTHSGFVRMNGRTIGNAASSATERANADTEDLYTFLWTNCANDQCAVSGGRGASAAADYGANKAIALPNALGRGFVNLDDQGASAANVAQVSTTVDTTNGSPTATLGSATGISIGMYIVSTNVPAGTTVSAIVGTTLTMSGNASGTANGTAARFSYLNDAQTPYTAGGAVTRTQVQANLPNLGAQSVAGSVAPSIGGQTPLGIANGTATLSVDGNDPDVNTYASSSFAAITTSHNLTWNIGGAGRPFGTMQPSMSCGFYMKL